MAEAKTRSFGRVIRERRRQLDFTQEEVARRIKASVPYIGHLEAAKRHPSRKVVVKLADALGLDAGDCSCWPIQRWVPSFPKSRSRTEPLPGMLSSKTRLLRKIHNISDPEMEMPFRGWR